MDHYRVCAKIDLDALSDNIKIIKNNIKTDAFIYAVIKTDAYGHGAVECAKHMQKLDGIGGFAVATYEEAKQLIEEGIDKPILILGYTFSHTYEDIIRLGIRPTIFTKRMADDYGAAADKLGKDVFCHIKLDTGMGRIGYPVTEKAADEIADIFKGNLRLISEGIFTHFARADETDKSAAAAQLLLFTKMMDMLTERGVRFRIRHAANSAAILDYDAAHLDAVRAGIILYGLMPSDEVGEGYGLRPVLSLKSHIVHIKEVKAGDSISYGGTYTAKENRLIATVSVGYGDGYSRGLSNKGEVIIRGKRAAIVGRVCMDQFMVDVTDIKDVSVLDEVVLVGEGGDDRITLEELGTLSGRFNYEFACDLGNRIPRLYYAKGKLISVKEYY